MKWNKVTDKMPQKGQQVLVYTRGIMFVAEADVYSEKDREQMRVWANDPKFHGGNQAIREHWRTCKGAFKDIGMSYYFDDPQVYWMELPEAPHDISIVDVQEEQQP